MENDKRKISGAITSKKIAMILTASALVLPLAGCGAKTIKPVEVQGPKNTRLCDTSSMNIDTMVHEYVNAYESGKTSYMLDKLEELKSSYELLRFDEREYDYSTKMTYPTNTEFSSIVERMRRDCKTYNFDGTLMDYEKSNGNIFWSKGGIVKTIAQNYVDIDTATGSIQMEEKDDSFVIKNDSDGRVTEITYNHDNSCELYENIGMASTSYIFDSDGKLASCIERTNEAYSRKEYENGDINVYKQYNYYNVLVEETRKDGSYSIFTTGGSIDKDRYGFDLEVYTADCQDVEYSYNKDGVLQCVNLTGNVDRGNTIDEFNAKLLPNGDSYEFLKVMDKDGNVIKTKKTEYVYKTSETVSLKETTDSGEEYDVVYKFDKTAISPSTINNWKGSIVRGDYEYVCINGVVTVERKDGITYKYDENDGSFYEAYKVDSDGITYFDEDLEKIKYKDKNGLETHYYSGGNVKYIANQSNEKVSVTANNYEIELESRRHVGFDKAGGIIMYSQDDENYYSMFPDGHTTALTIDGEVSVVEFDDSILERFNIRKAREKENLNDVFER